MFYDINKKELVYIQVHYKDVEFTDENGERHQGVDTYFLDNCDDETLRSLGFARVVKQEAPANEDIYKNLVKLENYDEAKNIYNISYEIRDVSLDDAEEIKANELQRLKNSKLSEFSYADKVFQTDTESKLNINGKISEIMLKIQLGQEVDSINWIAKDNTIKTFSKEEFLAFAIAVATHTEAVIFKHDQLRTAVNSATSIDEIKAVEWVD